MCGKYSYAYFVQVIAGIADSFFQQPLLKILEALLKIMQLARKVKNATIVSNLKQQEITERNFLCRM